MTVKTGSAWAGTFVTLDATGALATPSSGPVGVLYVDGTANAATVTITGSNPYKWAVTLPSLTAGQRVDMYITATIATIATAGFVASAQADTALLSEVKTDTAAILADTGTDGVKVASLATDSITADALKADAVTEIQSGLATAAGLSTISGLVDDLESRLTAARAGYLDKLNVAGELANTSNAYAFKADTVSVPQNVWSYHTRLLTNIGSTIESPAAGDPLNIYRDTTVLISLTNLGAIGVDDKLWFTVKDSVEEPDENSIIQIDRLGLLYINGAPASQVEDGSITVLDDVLGNVEIKLAQRQAALLPLYEAYPAQWDIKILHSGIVSILNIGTLYIKGTPTRAIL